MNVLKWIASNLAVIHLELRSNWLHFDDQRLEIKVTVITKNCGLVVVTVRLQEHLHYGYICYYVIIARLEHKHTFVHISRIQTLIVTKCHTRSTSFWHHMFDTDTFYPYDRKEGKWWSYFACETFLHALSSLPCVTSSPPPLTFLVRKTTMQVIK